MYERIKNEVYAAHKRVVDSHIDYLNSGIISARSQEEKCYAVKRKDITADKMTLEDIIIIHDVDVSFESLAPDIDDRFKTHLVLYHTYPYIHSIVQLDSKWCAIWSQAGNALPPLSALHARHYFGEVLCTNVIPALTKGEDFYIQIGKLITETLTSRVVNHSQAVFIRHMGAITWGASIEEAVDNALILEEDACRAWQVRLDSSQMYQYLPFEVSERFYFEENKHTKQNLNHMYEQKH